MFIIITKLTIPLDLQSVEYGNHDHYSRQKECAQYYCNDIHQRWLELRHLWGIVL
jgi:hypothetical protein